MNCICSALGALEALAVWEGRLRPVIRRLLNKGHRVDSARIARVAELVIGLESGRPISMSPCNSHHSHHMEWCPGRCGGARTPVPNLSGVPSIARPTK